ncbi:hypothetical protein [Leifsonia sp. NPDC080035]|uniref:Uncharacterized protein n=1 Tax=Leifsonia sp. NPDC080035 TaxID=3143936 RepID=A0AAU7GCR8_9MICO
MPVAGDRRWALLDSAGPMVTAWFRSRGVVATRFVAAFPELPGAGIWLCTATDEERDDLRRDTELVTAARDVLHQVGFSPLDLAETGVVVESQQTVDREYGGSWFHAMR